VTAGLHHIELWVADLDEGREAWGWLLVRLGWVPHQVWADGASWRRGDAYLVVTRPPTLAGEHHDRRLPGMNHLAFHGGAAEDIDRLVSEGKKHGWVSLYADRYPYAGGSGHYAAYLENRAGFKVEIVAEVVPT
jgi:catechol 2,3-dioxygenase-like lactoylglutathione lyase family enzyme